MTGMGRPSGRPGTALLRPRSGALVLALLLSLLAQPPCALAFGTFEKGKVSGEAVGNVRLLGAYLHFPDAPLLFPKEDDGLFAAVARLILEMQLGGRLRFDGHVFAEFTHSPGGGMGGVFATAGSFESSYRNKVLSWSFWPDAGLQGKLGVDRFSFNLELDRVTLTLGRFPVNYSVTSIFTPNDFFAPFSAAAINKVYKPGVDALRLNVAAGELSSIELLAILGAGRDGVPGWGESAILVRAAATKWKFEWAVLGGKVAGRWVCGASVQGEAGPFGLRAEGHAGFPDGSGDGELDDLDGDGSRLDDIFGRVAAGFDLNFAWHNSSLGAEYMFISDGAAHPSGYPGRYGRLMPDDIAFLGRHYVGLTAGGEIIPILRLQAMALFNARDFSGLGAVFLVLNASDEIDIMAGLLAPWGREPGTAPWPSAASPRMTIPVIESEFGLTPLTAFIESRFYF